MSYNTLKALVNSKVYENAEQRITGGDMNDVLQSAIASLGAHYQMGGLVSPTDHITVGDEPVVFFATTPGTYTYFGSQVVADGEVALLVWSGTAWSKQTPDIATRTEVSQLGQKLYDFALSSTPSESIDPSDLIWEQKTITTYVKSASNNRCIALVRLANVSHIKIVPASNWYINLWFYKEFMPSSELTSADYGVSNVGSTSNTIDVDVPSGARMMAIWCRKADQSNFTPSDAPASLTSVEFTTDHAIVNSLQTSVNGLLGAVLVHKQLLTSAKVLTDLPDADDALPNTLYLIVSSNNWPTNMPSGLSADGNYRYIVTIENVNDTNVVNRQQYILDASLRAIYYRRLAGTWTAWQSLVDADTSFKVYPTAIRRQNYTTLLPDADGAEDNTMYLVYTNQGTAPSNFPSEYQGDGSYYLLHTSSYAVDATIVKMQTLDAVDGSEHYSRRYNGVQWTAWESNLHKVIYVGSGQAYTTIKSALEVANKYGNCDIYVLAGNYDIISEYGGQSALEEAVAGGDYGLRIGYGNRIHFATNAYVTCIYEGSNNLVMERFAPFNASTAENPKKQGFTLIGLNIDCKNVRYCVHDECAGTSKYRNHKYINCTMHLDNTTSQYISTYKSCIGGGLGKDCRIDIQGGYYKSETADAIKGAISYHNAVGTGATANARSEINVDGVYFDGGGTITFGYYGVSTLMTKCFVRNCSMGIAPNVHAESETYSTINMELYAWNNEIRS